MGKTQVLPDYPRGLDFEQVWAALMENREQQKEIDRLLKETTIKQDRRMEEADQRMKETDRQIKETSEQQKETDRQMKEAGRRMDEFNKRFGDFTNRFGEVVEYMIAPNLLEKFRDTGLCFTQAGPNRVFTDTEHKLSFEVDVMLENGGKAMLVEVKTKLTTEDVKEHVKRLGKMRAFADFHDDTRIFLGAVAGVVMTPQVKKFALGQGFFVIEPSGETFAITPPEGKPKEW